MKPSLLDICAIILLSAMFVSPRDRRLDRAICQNSVGTAKIEPAINLSSRKPSSIYHRPPNARPRRRAADGRDELAAPHSITSSTRPSNGRGSAGRPPSRFQIDGYLDFRGLLNRQV